MNAVDLVYGERGYMFELYTYKDVAEGEKKRFNELGLLKLNYTNNKLNTSSHRHTTYEAFNVSRLITNIRTVIIKISE